MLKTITSKTNPIIKYAGSLKDNATRKIEKKFLSEGKKSLDVALEAKLVEKVLTLKELQLPFDIEQYIVTPEIIDKLSNSKSPEGIVFIGRFIEQELKEFHKGIYLDNIQDPGNLGTIIRTAVAFGYDALFISKDTVDPYNDKVIAASKGAIFKLPIIRTRLREVRNEKKVIVSCLDDKAKCIDEIKINEDFILVLGNEAHGVRPEIIERADELVTIPMNNFESLNVSVAAGILLYHLAK